MKLISPFKSLIQGGVILTFKISAAGGENVQIDILPQGKDSATGVSLPPKALVGAAEEIDANLEEYLQKYAASVARVADVVANADAELKSIEAAAAAQAKKAVEEKSKSKSSMPPSAGSRSGSSPPPKNMKAGMLDDDVDTDDEPTTLMTTGTAGAPAAEAETSHSDPAAGAGNAVSSDLFMV